MSFHYKGVYRFCFILVLILSGITRIAGAVEIVVVQSSAIKPYQTALTSFQAALAPFPARGGKTMQPVQYHKIILADISPDTMRRDISRYNPDLVLAIGRKALVAVINFIEIPVFYLLVPDAATLIDGHSNVTGIDMEVAPEIQLKEVKRLLPQVRIIGMLYDPLRDGDFVREAEIQARQQGLEISSSPITSAKDVLQGLKSLAQPVDLLWMLPDLYQTSPMGREALFLFSLERKIPVMTFAPKYLKSGALLVVGFDVRGMGKEAAGLVNKFLNGPSIDKLPPFRTRQVKTTVNEIIRLKFDLEINSGNKP